MDLYQEYIFSLCLIVFVLLVSAFVLFLTLIIKYSIRLIKYGVEDVRLIKEYKSSKSKEKMSSWGVLNKITTILLSVALALMLLISIYINVNDSKVVKGRPAVKSVLSGSMSFKYENNKYLFDNKLDNQIQTYDLVLLRELPDEYDIKLYDIVMYEYDDTLILHRIVGIEEPNKDHPHQRLFVFQGDAVPSRDRKSVEYSQMKGIYKGERVPFIGSFVYFMQSPAGWLCLFLVVVVTVAMPIIDKKIVRAKYRRLIQLSDNKTSKIYDQIDKLNTIEAKDRRLKIKTSKKDERFYEQQLAKLLSIKTEGIGKELLKSKVYDYLKENNFLDQTEDSYLKSQNLIADNEEAYLTEQNFLIDKQEKVVNVKNPLLNEENLYLKAQNLIANNEDSYLAEQNFFFVNEKQKEEQENENKNKNDNSFLKAQNLLVSNEDSYLTEQNFFSS